MKKKKKKIIRANYKISEGDLHSPSPFKCPLESPSNQTNTIPICTLPPSLSPTNPRNFFSGKTWKTREPVDLRSNLTLEELKQNIDKEYKEDPLPKLKAKMSKKPGLNWSIKPIFQ